MITFSPREFFSIIIEKVNSIRDRKLREKYYFIAIGGIGMSGLAKYLLENGYEVSGSDINDSKYIDKLRNLGAKVYIGHDERNLPIYLLSLISEPDTS